ncbi:TonB-dependent receptor [Dyella jejuensis]|uniref:TonB-dependent receptor n=1 Tax=Dyella jejuensis TaxID=1432009 RepID=A0ABW8JFB2_9GAMM
MKKHVWDNRARYLGLLLALPYCALAQAQTQPAAAPSATDQTTQKSKPSKGVTNLKAVTVTAERRDKPLQTSPVAATVLSGDDLSKMGVNVVDQLQFASPSATVNNFGQGIDFDIRGIGKAENNTQTTTGVITYRDGVATFPGYFTEEPYYDIASVQILRGPQGTFGGQNAIGGAVLVNSNDPVINGGYHGYAQAQVGNYGDVGLQAAINLPISNTLAARIAVDSDNRDSFWNIKGPYTGSNARQRDRSIRLGLLWQPIENLSVLFKTDYDHLDMGAYPADPVNSPNNPFDITANADLMALDRFMRSVLKIDYKFANGVDLRAISGYQHGNTSYRTDLDGTDLGDETFRDSVNETIYSQEINLISPDSGWFTWILGAYWQRDTYDFLPGQYLIGLPAGNPATEYTLQGTNPKTNEAAFGQVTFQLADPLKLDIGGRFSKSTTSNDVSVVQYGLPLLDQQSASYTNFSGKVSLDYTLNDRNFLYAFVATGFRPGGLNVPVGLGIPAPFKAEKVINQEIGWKAQWLGGHLRTQVDAYHNNYENFQVTIGYPDNPTFGIEMNTPNLTKIYGFESSAQLVFGNWSLNGNLGWMHSELGLFYATDPRIIAEASCNPMTGPASASCFNLAGHEQTYAPNLTYNISLERVFNIGNDSITPRLSYAHISPQWATLFENELLGDRLQSRNLLGAQIDWSHGDFLTTLYGSNLTNQRYIAAINSNLRFAGAPRQFGVRVTKYF